MLSKAQLDHMQLMYAMCQREVEQLQRNLSRFLLDNVPQAQNMAVGRVEGVSTAKKNDLGENVFVLMAYDGYMSRLGAVANLARKFNIQMQLNNANNALGGVGPEMSPTYLLKEFVQWNNILKGKDVLDVDLSLKPIDGIGCASIHKQHHVAIAQNSAEQSATEQNTAEQNAALTATTANELAQPCPSPAFHKVRFDLVPTTTSEAPPSCVLMKDLTSFVPGYRFSATITYIVDSKQLIFYICQMNNSDLYELSNMLCLPKCALPPPPNTIFGIATKTKNMLRAVLKVVPAAGGGTETRILLIDYGEEVPLRDNCQLYHIPSKFQKVPAQAVKCILVGKRSGEHDINETDRHLLAVALQRNEFREVMFEVVRSLGRVLYLRMLEDDTKAFQDTNEQFSMESPQSTANSSNPFRNLSNDKSDELVINARRKLSSAPKLEASKYICSTKFADASNASSNVVPVCVTHIAGVDCFYAQINKQSSCLKDPLFWADDVIQPDLKLTCKPHVNDLVLAQYSIDRFWYRAVVLETVDADKTLFKVFFVDYGNTETVTFSNLAKCALTEDVEPFRAIRCRLADVYDNTGDDEIGARQAVETLFVMLLNQTVHVAVVSKNDEEWLVRFVEEEFKSIPTMLLNMGYVKEAQNGVVVSRS